ncbi:hypothetical protein ACFVMC_28460 [Nocardia sp. NPDC127579]|uniref:hypothetical protein n=1 Tax=Nocardia sp. NPDC127579 TaxID=3345402 RepID=UPI003631934F
MNSMLAERLFVARERWGWEFREPVEQASGTDLMPEFVEPEPVSAEVMVERTQRRSQSVRGLWTRLKISGVVLVVVLVVLSGDETNDLDPDGTYFFLTLLVVIGFSFGPVVLSSAAVRSGQPTVRRRRAQRRHRAALRAWEQRQAHRRELSAEQAGSRWQPVDLRSGATRIDVFGGSGHGWASLLTTFGASALRSGSAVVILDFTDEDVANALGRCTVQVGHRAVKLDFPADLEIGGLLDGLSPDDVAEILAASIRPVQSPSEQEDLRALDAELLELAAAQLQTTITLERLSQALSVLRRTYRSAGSTALSEDETRRLVEVADATGESDRNLQFLASELGHLARAAARAESGPAPHRPTPRTWWDEPGLVVATCSSPHARRRRTMQRVLFERALHELSGRSGRARDRVLVVAGADCIGRERLTEMALQARRGGTRLVFVMERLHGDLRELIGTAHSAAILMQLGHDQDAAAAAEFIGRDHKFTLSQLTVEFGKQVNWSESDGVNKGYGDSGTKGGSRQWNEFIDTQKSRSVTDSRNIAWSRTTTVGGGTSEGRGEVTAREYEFIVEPTRFQALPPTAFCLVEPAGEQRRIVFGDCNPGLVLHDRISRELDSPARTR